MPTAQENLGIAALVFTTIAFVIIIVIVAQTFIGRNGIQSPGQWTAIAAVSAIALGLLLTEIGLVVPYTELYNKKDEEDDKSKN
jgi:uncharacterized membrane protein